MKLSVLSRSSQLAKLQVEEALPRLRKAFPEAEFEIRDTLSIGDRDLTTPLTDPSIPTDYFTREIDEAQLAGEVDLAIHSAKDLPQPLRDGVVVAALFPAADVRDALVIRNGLQLTDVRVVGTSSPTREIEIRHVIPDCECRGIRGTIEQRLEQLDAGDYDAVIIAACALDRLGLAKRISRYLDYETTPQQGRLAVTVSAARPELIQALRTIDVRRSAGMVACVGCPADASLLSGHARTLLDAADIVLHDRLIPAPVIQKLGNRAEYVGKEGHSHSTTQNHIHRRILHEAESGKLVVRLHGGEPGILGHLGETLEFCRAWNLRTEVVPAVSAAQVAAARAQASLTHRNQGRSVTFLSGHAAAEQENLPLPSPNFGNIALYMGVRDLPAICNRLRDAGWPEDTSITAGERIGQEEERLVFATLADIQSREIEAPAVFLIGPDSHLGSGYTLFTGTDPSKFYKYGPLLHLPFIQLKTRDADGSLQNRLADWDGAIFPSSFAVHTFMQHLQANGDIRDLAGKKILAVGPMTETTLRSYGLKADASPTDFGGVNALAEMTEESWKGVYGYPCSNLAPTSQRQNAVAAAGIQLDPVVLYDNAPVQHERLPRLPFDKVLFTSSSCVENYFSSFPDEKTADREWIAVGTSTLATLDELGLSGVLLGK